MEHYEEIKGKQSSCLCVWDYGLCFSSVPYFCVSQDVVCPEAVKLDDLDMAAITSQYEAAKSAFNSAAAGSIEQAEAQIDMEVNKAMATALGTTLA